MAKMFKNQIPDAYLEEIKEQMILYDEDDFKKYTADVGWEEWMDEFTDVVDESELIPESDIKKIEKIQEEIWEEVHQNKNEKMSTMQL